jgi:hypothetical protein
MHLSGIACGIGNLEIKLQVESDCREESGSNVIDHKIAGEERGGEKEGYS